MGCCSSVDGKKEALLETLGDHESAINCMAISDDGSMIVTGSDDTTAIMWSIEEDADGTENIGRLVGHSSYINTVAIVDFKGQAWVLTGSADGSIRKWNAKTCECRFVYEGHTARVIK